MSSKNYFSIFVPHNLSQITENRNKIAVQSTQLFKDYTDPRIIIRDGQTILQWTQIHDDLYSTDKIYIERRHSESDWETVAIYHSDSSTFTHKFIDETNFIPARNQRIFIVSYRLKILKQNGICEFSSEISYDFWWKKYLSFIEHYENAPYLLSNEIFNFIEHSIENVLYKKYISVLSNRNVDEYYIIDEACQEIFLKLLENRQRPRLNYYSFWKYVNSMVNNWMVSYLLRSRDDHFVRLTEDVQEIEKSPEERMISREEQKLFHNAFSNLFKVYLDELWTTFPLCALITESWIRRKKGFLENFSECFSGNASRDSRVSGLLRLDELDFETNDTNIYMGILLDIIGVGENPSLMKKLLKRIPDKKRAAFQSKILECSSADEDKSINRIKQNLNRALTIIRVKMQGDLKDF